jgi:hypothetical protein
MLALLSLSGLPGVVPTCTGHQEVMGQALKNVTAAVAIGW